jgi:hypothetical protein
MLKDSFALDICLFEKLRAYARVSPRLTGKSKMLSFPRTTCTTPVAFREEKHHWAFKYWKGDAVTTGRKIVGELCTAYGLRGFSLPGQLRTEYATCSRHLDNNLFCSCCKVDNCVQTLLRIVGNLINPYCNLERYMNSGLDSLEPYSIAPQRWEDSVEVVNLKELVDNDYPWQELVQRIYSRRHWVAVRDLATAYVNQWLLFFDNLASRAAPFTEEEKQDWTHRLLEPPLSSVIRGELLMTADELDHIAHQNIAKMIQLSDLEEIPAERLAHLRTLRNSDIHCRWSHSSQLDKRGQFIEQIVGRRERHRRAANLMRKLHDSSAVLHERPPRKLSTEIWQDEPFELPRREHIVCNILLDNEHFAEDLYWPILDCERLSYRHSILRTNLEQFRELFEWVLFDLGELNQMHILVGPVSEQISANTITAFLVPNHPTLPTLIKEICRVAAATDDLRIDCKPADELVYVQLRGNIVDEAEIDSWQ